MFKPTRKSTLIATAVITAVFFNMFTPLVQVRGADHAESTSVANDPGADIADVFAYLDPADNTKVILAMDVEGFIVPSELLNLSYFAPDILYRFEIENTGNAVADSTIDITFSPQTSRSTPQTATIQLNGINGNRAKSFTAPTTVQTLNATANPYTVTTNAPSGVSFFAGLTDDPFYFDIVGFNRFVGSVLGGTPDPTRLQRSRDSFAGYNIHMIALKVPAAMLRGTAGSVIGINGVTMRQRSSTRQSNGTVVNTGNYVQVDRMATPAVNTALIPFPRKNEYNAATPLDDANGVFAGDIVATLMALGTNSTNINILAGVAVVNGDFLRLNLDTPNNNLGFGQRITDPNYTGFPNGRRPGDDTVDTLLYLITNQAILMGDNVNSNELPFGATFPYFSAPNQPLENPAIDNTQN
jgi:hypothetical protein